MLLVLQLGCQHRQQDRRPSVAGYAWHQPRWLCGVVVVAEEQHGDGGLVVVVVVLWWCVVMVLVVIVTVLAFRVGWINTSANIKRRRTSTISGGHADWRATSFSPYIRGLLRGLI